MYKVWHHKSTEHLELVKTLQTASASRVLGLADKSANEVFYF